MKGANLREKWSTKFDFVFVTMGTAIGLGNLWRFPYLCYKNGGGAFLIPYFVTLMLIVLPHLILQTALGQYTSKSSIKAWGIVPIMRGLGFACVFIGYGAHMIYGTIISWSLRYLYSSFFKVLPWTTCSNTWNTPNCSAYEIGNLTTETTFNISIESSSKVSAAVEFWENNVLQLTDGIHNLGALRLDLIICMFLTWGIAFLCVFKSINWTSKITYVTASLPPIMLLAIFIRGILLDGASDGIKYFVSPNISKLIEPQVWKEATLQNMYSLSLTSDIMITLGSYNNYNHNFYRDSMILCAANSGASILSGFTVFATLGFMAKQQNTSIETVAESGPGLAFTVYPQALSMMPFAQFWSVLFFLTLFLLGLDSLFAFIEAMIAIVQDMYPSLRKKRYIRSLIGMVVVVSSALIGLTTVTQGGIYVITLVDNYIATGWGVMIVVVLESITISWLYGTDKFYRHVCDMLGFRPKFPWFKYCWKYVSPITCIGMFIYCLITDRTLTYNRDYVFPTWSIAIGWILSLSGILFVPGFALVHTLKKFFRKQKRNNLETKDPVELVELNEIQ